jgi:plastocyanin
MRTRIWIGGATLALVAAACSGVDEPAACADPASGARMQLLDFEYAPRCLEVTGEEVALTNPGDVPHTFTLPDTDVDVRVDPDGEGRADLGGLAPGTYRVICTLHPQMTAAIRIS